MYTASVACAFEENMYQLTEDIAGQIRTRDTVPRNDHDDLTGYLQANLNKQVTANVILNIRQQHQLKQSVDVLTIY